MPRCFVPVMYQTILGKEDCPGGDELCAPCISPLDQTATGACANQCGAIAVTEDAGPAPMR